jgi:hypothetical protein
MKKLGVALLCTMLTCGAATATDPTVAAIQRQLETDQAAAKLARERVKESQQQLREAKKSAQEAKQAQRAADKAERQAARKSQREAKQSD